MKHHNNILRTTLSKFPGQSVQCGSFTVVNPHKYQRKFPNPNLKFPDLVDAIFELEQNLSSETIEFFTASTHCTINRNVEYTPHFDNGSGQEGTFSTIVGLGDYIGGEFVVDDKEYNIRYNALKFDGWRQIHATKHFKGERFSLVWFTPEIRDSCSRGMNFEDAKARKLADQHSLSLPNYKTLKFRENSTDALVINEILDTYHGCTYELSPGSWRSMINLNNDENGFTLKGHHTVLDVGAHIGIFCRYALTAGCTNIIAYEPERENLKLLEKNLKSLHSEIESRVTIYDSAVAHGEPSTKHLIHARNRADGSLNTWRHSLEEYSQYVDRNQGSKTILSNNQDTCLDRSEVQTVPFFGRTGALVGGVTFVKMDCEGAEIDILLSSESSIASNWLDVKNLVFEWSFTKERRIRKFHLAIQNLKSAGFRVAYQGQGSWWDEEINGLWPYHSDLVVYARK